MEPKPVINIADIELSSQKQGDHFEAELGAMASAIGAQQLGCKLTILPPGKKGWPFHNHHANEEMFFILEGSGTYRIGENTYPIKQGDLLVAPAGGKETAHQIVNSSQAPLKYLALSTMHEPDIMEYPDSNKFGIVAGSAPGGNKASRTFSKFVNQESSVDYWDGES